MTLNSFQHNFMYQQCMFSSPTETSKAANLSVPTLPIRYDNTHRGISLFVPAFYYNLQWSETRGKLSGHVITTFCLQDANSGSPWPTLCLTIPIVTTQTVLQCQIIPVITGQLQQSIHKVAIPLQAWTDLRVPGD